MMNFVEFADWGWNAVTIGFLGTVVFTILQSWGVIKQAIKIWKEKSGLSISVILFYYNLFGFSVALVYGLSSKSLALILIGSAMFVTHVPIIIGLFKFKEIKLSEEIIFIVLFMLAFINIFLPYKDIFFFGFNFGTILVLLLQPYEIWKNKNAGVIEIRLILVFLLSTIFWFIYGVAINDWVLKIATPCFFMLHSSIIILWYIYKQPKIIMDEGGW